MKIKSILALLMTVLMMFSLAACGGDGDTNTTDAPQVESTTAPATEAPTEAAPEPVAVGDVTIEYLRAEKYAPFENGETILVYCKFTNNSTEETSAYKTLYLTAKCNGETVQEMDYLEDDRPEGFLDYAKTIAPGESIEIFYTLDYVDGVIDITIQDLYNTIPEKLEFSIDASAL
ncbi:MAG: DUF5067 domain-containing protein [Ruminococcaceae bacterium]|nr:DUF5067 domain-containing protein [Oscillospiraceae bacterium]